MKATRWSRPRSTARPSRFETRTKRRRADMRRKQQIQALQQELALLRQTVDSGKELAALAADAAGQLRKPGLRTVAVQVMRSPRVRRAALIVGGTVTAVTLGAAAGGQKGAQARQRPPRCAAGDRGRRGRGRGRCARQGAQEQKAQPLTARKKSSVSDRKRSFFIWFLSFRPAIR